MERPPLEQRSRRRITPSWVCLPPWVNDRLFLTPGLPVFQVRAGRPLPLPFTLKTGPMTQFCLSRMVARRVQPRRGAPDTTLRALFK